MGELIGFDIDSRSTARVRDGILQSSREATLYATRTATRAVERELEDETRSAVPGKLWRAWASKFYENPGGWPAGIVYVNGGDRSQGAMAFWTREGRVMGKAGQWLAIPTDAVPRRGRRGKRLTPVEVEAEFNKELSFIPAGRGRKYAMLVLEGVRNARSGRYRPMTKRRAAADRRAGRERAVETVVMFTLIPWQAFGNRFAIGPVIERGGRHMMEAYVSRIQTSR